MAFKESSQPMNDSWVDFAIRIQSIAQTGLAYAHDPYDLERYSELREIAARMLALKTDLPVGKIRDLFCNETGYQTPKIDTRAALFEGGRILLVCEKDGRWALPGGWCDVDRSVGENTVKELYEESGYRAAAKRIIALQDWRRHNVCNFPYGIIKIFMLCESLGGSFRENIETESIGFFTRDDLPHDLALQKTTPEQILMCFDAYENPDAEVLFD